MKRHPALQDLSRDHHAILILCQQIRKAMVRGPSLSSAQELAEDLLRFRRSDLDAHFEEEDRFALDAAKRSRDPALVDLARDLRGDHEWLRGKLAALSAGLAEDGLGTKLLMIGDRLDRHVRREEAELFEGLQKALTEDDLQRLWQRSYAYRSTHRSPEACTLRPKPAP